LHHTNTNRLSYSAILHKKQPSGQFESCQFKIYHLNLFSISSAWHYM